MNTYVIQWETWTTTGPSWEYEFTTTSDAFAIDYTARVAANDIGFRAGGVALNLFRRGENEVHLARFVLDKPKVRNTLEGDQ